MAIPNGDGVDGTTIHAKAKSVDVLGYQDDGNGARTQALADMSHGKKFLNLAREFNHPQPCENGLATSPLLLSHTFTHV